VDAADDHVGARPDLADLLALRRAVHRVQPGSEGDVLVSLDERLPDAQLVHGPGRCLIDVGAGGDELERELARLLAVFGDADLVSAVAQRPGGALDDLVGGRGGEVDAGLGKGGDGHGGSAPDLRLVWSVA
jgi:hypothetical protein